MAKIKVIIKEPGKVARFTYISPSLRNLQNWVGGNIETFTFAEDMTLICNEEGKLLNLPYNFDFLGQSFVGICLFVGIKGAEFCSVPDQEGLLALLALEEKK